MAKDKMLIPKPIVELYMSSHHYIKQRVNAILKIPRYLPFDTMCELEVTESEYAKICNAMGWEFVTKALMGLYENKERTTEENLEYFNSKKQLRATRWKKR